MPSFLTTTAISSEIESILRKARDFIYLVSPYLQISRSLLERMTDAADREVSMTIVYGKDELSPSEWNKLESLDRIAVHYLENLHAKCYANEQRMVIGSMNVYEFSERTNREMGVLLTRSEDGAAFEEALEEVRSILKASEQRMGPGIRPQAHGRSACIRCGSALSYDRDRPMCRDCYDIWSRYRDPMYGESFCHSCGARASVCMAMPLCKSCFAERGFA